MFVFVIAPLRSDRVNLSSLSHFVFIYKQTFVDEIPAFSRTRREATMLYILQII